VTLGDLSEWIEITPSGAFTITLPTPPTKGIIKKFVDVTGVTTTHIITIAGNGKNINGSANYTMNSDFETVWLRYNGTQWNIV